jgi:hypothetical protein
MRRSMTHNPKLLKVEPDIIVNIDDVAYIELTGKGGMDIHFVGNVKPLHFKPTQAESVRDYVSGDNVTDISTAA